MEHTLVSIISKHFSRYGIFNDFQHGFRRARSCETQLIAFIDYLAKKKSREEAKRMSLLWTLARYFTRFHTMACYTNCLSVHSDITLQRLKSFLEKRRQSLVLEGEHSHPITSGVTQLSVRFLTMISHAMLSKGSVFLPMTLSFTLQ